MPKEHMQFLCSFEVWRPSRIIDWITTACGYSVKHKKALIIEWWLHNIAYYLTRPFISIPFMKKLNERAKHVDLILEADI